MRIGQIVFAPIVKIQLQLGDVNIFETDRSSKGFGSTGLE
jgi:dUTPase